MKYPLGRYLYALAAIGFGICALLWHDINNWPQLKTYGDLTRELLTAIVGILEILGGAALLWPRTARAGALVLTVVSAGFSLLALPSIFKHPLIYNNYGNFFEQLSLFAGALILYARSGTDNAQTAKLARAGYYAFGVCVLSFGLEQLFYLSPTASLVPKWIPPGQNFWAIATTVAFGLAALALLTGVRALLAARLTTVMLAAFGLLVWVPALIADPRNFENWSEGLETLAVAATAWIVTALLGEREA